MGGAEGVPGSREEVRETLVRLGLHPHKRFGQNFLADAGALGRIVERSGVGPGSVVLEVGPGLGTLTRRLRDAGASVVAVEIDHGLARHVRAVFGGDDDVVLVERDVMARKGHIAEEVAAVLREMMARKQARRFDVVSNLPYGISSSFITSLVFEPGPPGRATVMLQSEVAAVLAAKPDTEDYSALSVFARTFFEIRQELVVPRHAFFPQPDVDSTVVSLAPRPGPHPDPERFGRFVQGLFQGRRKALSTTVRKLVAPDRGAEARSWLEHAGFDPTARVDALESERIVELFAKVEALGRLHG
jgi:16S rRNA (adenine1518-N6/adenine1519-N6)-dimethyltransferase